MSASETSIASPTPGPWFCDRAHVGNRYYVAAKDPKSHSGMIGVADLYQQLTSEAKANARLIAAAPDLLQACIDALDYISDEACEDEALMAAKHLQMEQLERALAKARGEA